MGPRVSKRRSVTRLEPTWTARPSTPAIRPKAEHRTSCPSQSAPWHGAVDPGLLPWGAGEQASRQYARATIINAHSPPGDRLVLFTPFFSSRLILIFTLLTLSRRCCVCVSLSLIVLFILPRLNPDAHLSSTKETNWIGCPSLFRNTHTFSQRCNLVFPHRPSVSPPSILGSLSSTTTTTTTTITNANLADRNDRQPCVRVSREEQEQEATAFDGNKRTLGKRPQ